MSGGIKAVAAGAQLRCSVGSTPSVLIATSAVTVVTEGKVLASVMDHVPIANIPPFGVCSITGGPCVPVLPAPWTPSLTGLVTVSAPILPFNSTLLCAVGGQIMVADCNQNSITMGEDRPEAKPWSAEQQAASDAIRQGYVDLFPKSEAAKQFQQDLKTRQQTARQDMKAAERTLDRAEDELEKARERGGNPQEAQQRVQDAKRNYEEKQRDHKKAGKAGSQREQSTAEQALERAEAALKIAKEMAGHAKDIHQARQKVRDAQRHYEEMRRAHEQARNKARRVTMPRGRPPTRGR
ncbi:MAG TPA: PAAR-like protein [Roseiflexaceae bacterium]|nr:PAAR-like protein [Roseiflexaceae bacterium]